MSIDVAGPYTYYDHAPVERLSARRVSRSTVCSVKAAWARVYLARDSRLPRDVAIKRVRPVDDGGPEGRARLVREATILSQLTHPHICTLYELFEDGDQAYLAMEALQGESLDARLARSPPQGLPIPTVLTIGAQVAEGLAFAHGRGVTHQDIKPANIVLTPAGAKILDFGIARLRDPGASHSRTATVTVEALASGTLPYMAPEQLDGRADARSDIFALGAVLYEMLTGGRAFAGDSTASIVGQIVDARRPALPAGDLSRRARQARRQVPGDRSSRAVAVGRRSGRRAAVDRQGLDTSARPAVSSRPLQQLGGTVDRGSRCRRHHRRSGLEARPLGAAGERSISAAAPRRRDAAGRPATGQ